MSHIRATDPTEPAIHEALAALVGTRTATIDGTGRVVAVGGLSIVPAALRTDAFARTRCGRCGTRLDLTLTAGRPPADSSVVGWLPGATCTNVQADFCPAANLFCDPAHLTVWRQHAGDPPGLPATLSELATLGAQVWAEMAPTASPDQGDPR